MAKATPGDNSRSEASEGEIRRLAAESEDPFAVFAEWASEADREGYADL